MRKALGSSSGQAAIILILIIAALLIFYAVSINFGKFTDVKSIVSVSANTSASMLASSMTSYGQMLSETSLKGGRKICGWTGIIAAIIVIIIIIIVVYTQQYYLLKNLATVAGALAVTGLALAVVALALQVAVIQPGITEAWNRIINKTLSLNNQFTENAIQSALGKVVTDQVTVPDVTDMDLDRLWVSSPLEEPPWEDVISRYSAYYSERLRGIERGAAVDAIEEFLNALDAFLNAGASGWGIHDHLPPQSCFGTAECHPCCQPESAENNEPITGETYIVGDIRPEECDDGGTNWEVECANASPYEGDYPWVYDPAYENPDNNVYSFRELIGKDDENIRYYKDKERPNDIPQTKHFSGTDPLALRDRHDFYIEDATGYYVKDNRKGVHPFFHKMSEWGVNLATNKPSDSENNPRHCHWCDARGAFEDEPCFDCLGTNGYDGPHPHPMDPIYLDDPDSLSPPEIYKESLHQLALPIDPVTINPIDPSLGTLLQYNTTYHVDGINPTGGTPPLAVDKVRDPRYILSTHPSLCAEDFEDDTGSWALRGWSSAQPNWCAADWPRCAEAIAVESGFWKTGGDRYCSADWPYHLECPKHQGKDLACEDPGANPPDFPDDAIDGMYYGLGEFVVWAEKMLELGRADLEKFAAEFALWYPEVARWIESDSLCFSCDLEDPDTGILHIYRDQVLEVYMRIYYGWIHANNFGGSCEEVWCMPPVKKVGPQPCPLMQSDEIGVFNCDHKLGPSGVQDILCCLGHNTGNAARFENCFDACNACQLDYMNCSWDTNKACGGTLDPRPALATPDDEWLPVLDPKDGQWDLTGPQAFPLPNSYLPRTLVPGFDPTGEFRGEAMANTVDANFIEDTLNCLDMTECDQCRLSCECDCREDKALCVNLCESAWSNCSLVCDGTHPDGSPEHDACKVDCDNARDLCLDNPDDPLGCEQLFDCDAPGVCAVPEDEVDQCKNNCACGGCSSLQRVCSFGCTAVVDPNPGDLFTLDDIRQQCTDTCLVECKDCLSPVVDPGSCSSACMDLFDECQIKTNNSETQRFCTEIEADGITPVLEAEMKSRRGACLDPYDRLDGLDSFLDKIDMSIPEAINQGAKFAKRSQFLQARLNEANDTKDIFFMAFHKFEEFLDGPAADLIQARKDFEEDETGLPYHAIYGWKDEPPDPEDPTVPGKWHIVKVEARLPGNCDNNCGPGQTGPDPEWPKIKTYTKSWGTKRCYELVNVQGSVKFRTIRFDEERISDAVHFPNKLPFWKFRSAHPKRPQGPDYQPGGVFDPAQLEEVCASSQIDTFVDGSPTEGIYDGAFILEDYTGGRGPDDNSQCWNLAHELLARGVVDETCAEYFWDTASGRMNFRFVPCLEF